MELFDASSRHVKTSRRWVAYHRSRNSRALYHVTYSFQQAQAFKLKRSCCPGFGNWTQGLDSTSQRFSSLLHSRLTGEELYLEQPVQLSYPVADLRTKSPLKSVYFCTYHTYYYILLHARSVVSESRLWSQRKTSSRPCSCFIFCLRIGFGPPFRSSKAIPRVQATTEYIHIVLYVR